MLQFVQTHALQIPLYLALLTAVLRMVYAVVSRAVAPYPRARALVEAIAAASPDVLRALGQLYRLITGRDLPMAAIDVRDAELARLRDTVAAQAARLQALESADTRAQDPLSRRATLVPPVAGMMLLVMALTAAAGCQRPLPGADGGVVTPSGVVATLDTIATILDVLLPVIRPLVLREVPEGPAKAPVLHSLTGFEVTAHAWQEGRLTWDARGADRCTAYALSGALTDATRQLVRDLARAGVGWGPDLEGLLTSLGRLVDRYVGACPAVDGGALTARGRAGTAIQEFLRDVEIDAHVDGVRLRPLPAARR